MDNNIKEALDREVLTDVQNLDQLTQGDDVFVKATDALAKLYKMKIDQEVADHNYEDSKAKQELAKDQLELEREKSKQDYELKKAMAEKELELKAKMAQDELQLKREIADREYELNVKKAKSEKKDRIFRLVLDSAGIVLPLGTYIMLTAIGYNLEYKEHGMVTSPTLKDVLRNIKPTRK